MTVDMFEIVGTTVADKYLVERAVDEGGFSVVYKAEHTIWRQPVALKCFKVLNDLPESHRDKLLQAFVQEGQLLAALSSRTAAIVQARDIGTFMTKRGVWVPFMVMEWLEGRPLDAVLDLESQRRLPNRSIEEVLRFLDPAAVALDVAHQRNIAHRDIKPGNFFVIGDPRGPDAFVKVLDFGIAKVMAEHAAESASSAHTGREITSFTPNYGAPEQFSRSHGATGPWTDVFALALVVVEMLIGRPPLDGDDYLQFAVQSRDPARRPTPRTFGVMVPDAVEQVLTRALSVSPSDRPRTAGEFWRDLHRAATGGSWVGTGGATTTDPRAPTTPASEPAPTAPRATTPLGPDERISTPQAYGPATPQQVPASSAAAAPRSKAPLVVGGLAVVGALAGGGIFLATRGSGGAGPSGSASASAQPSARRRPRRAGRARPRRPPRKSARRAWCSCPVAAS
jgi:serine/threonine protein kinase